jgi:hypothetical protein
MFIKPSKTYFFNNYFINRYVKNFNIELRTLLSECIITLIKDDFFDERVKKLFIISLSKCQIGKNLEIYDNFIQNFIKETTDNKILL